MLQSVHFFLFALNVLLQLPIATLSAWCLLSVLYRKLWCFKRWFENKLLNCYLSSEVIREFRVNWSFSHSSFDTSQSPRGARYDPIDEVQRKRLGTPRPRREFLTAPLGASMVLGCFRRRFCAEPVCLPGFESLSGRLKTFTSRAFAYSPIQSGH